MSPMLFPHVRSLMSVDRFYLVTNAGRAERDMAWLKLNVELWNGENKDQVKMEIMSGWGLIALQGQSHFLLPPRVRTDVDAMHQVPSLTRPSLVSFPLPSPSRPSTLDPRPSPPSPSAPPPPLRSTSPEEATPEKMDSRSPSPPLSRTRSHRGSSTNPKSSSLDSQRGTVSDSRLDCVCTATTSMRERAWEKQGSRGS